MLHQKTKHNLIHSFINRHFLISTYRAHVNNSHRAAPQIVSTRSSWMPSFLTSMIYWPSAGSTAAGKQNLGAIHTSLNTLRVVWQWCHAYHQRQISEVAQRQAWNLGAAGSCTKLEADSSKVTSGSLMDLYPRQWRSGSLAGLEECWTLGFASWLHCLEWLPIQFV